MKEPIHRDLGLLALYWGAPRLKLAQIDLYISYIQKH